MIVYRFNALMSMVYCLTVKYPASVTYSVSQIFDTFECLLREKKVCVLSDTSNFYFLILVSAPKIKLIRVFTLHPFKENGRKLQTMNNFYTGETNH